LQAPKERQQEFEGYTATISKSIVATTTESQKVGKSSLYKGDVTVVDPYRL
jgi:hypothetical protein